MVRVSSSAWAGWLDDEIPEQAAAKSRARRVVITRYLVCMDDVILLKIGQAGLSS